jgi:Rieske Fe-S protein
VEEFIMAKKVTEQTRKERRTVINLLLGTSLGTTLMSIAYPILRFLVPPKLPESTQRSVVAGHLSELKPNSGKIFQFGTKPGIIVRTAEGELKACSATCTHLDCTVQYREDLRHIWCACHNGQYDLNGGNLSGPPPRPLEQYVVNVRGEEIIVSKG